MPRAARHPVVPRHLAVERPVDGASAADTRAAFRDAEASPDGPAATEADEARRSAFPDVEAMGRQAVDPLDVQMRPGSTAGRFRLLGQVVDDEFEPCSR